MCGRFALGIPRKQLEELLFPFASGHDSSIELPAPLLRRALPERYVPSWNIAPTQEVLALTANGADMYPWGFPLGRAHPGRAQTSYGTSSQLRSPAHPSPPEQSPRPALIINARTETVYSKPLFARAIRATRCIVPAQAFYEWERGTGKTRQPFAIAGMHNGLLMLGGILIAAELADSRAGYFPSSAGGTDRMNGITGTTGINADTALRMPSGITHDRSPCFRLVILTTASNSRMASIHDRMPLLLHATAQEAWLNTDTPQSQLTALFSPAPDSDIRMWPVRALVNHTGNNGPELLDARPASGITDEQRSLF